MLLLFCEDLNLMKKTLTFLASQSFLLHERAFMQDKRVLLS